MIHIPKNILKKLKLKREDELKKEAEEIEESRAIENTKRFTKSLEIVDKIGKEIGEMREWRPYCKDPKTYNPFGIEILSCNKQQLLQLLIHAYGTADHLNRELKALKKCVDGKK
jgi:tRNA A37 N6-isopentenylltransferase MiaA